MAVQLKKIPEPIGKWLIENAKKSFQSESGTYYHYVEVCRLLQLMKDERVSKESLNENSNGNRLIASSSLSLKCNCGQNCLPYDAVFTVKKCKRCGNYC